MREVSSGFEALAKIFESLDLEFAEKILSRGYISRGSIGRPHKNLVGMFRVELVKRLKGVESYRELHRLLQMDEALRSLCDIEQEEKRLVGRRRRVLGRGLDLKD